MTEVATIVGTLLIVSLGIFLIVFVLEFNKRQNRHYKEKELMNAQFDQTLLRSQIEVQEATFSTLGKELHDNIGQLLSTAKMLIGLTQQQMPAAPGSLQSAYDILTKAINEVRSISKTLNKEWLEQFNLADNLHAEAEHLNASDAVKVHLEVCDLPQLTTDKQVILFRIIQEAIQNAIKHAHCKNIYIKSTAEDNVVTVCIEDDGAGFDLQAKSNGVGIMNMKQRTKMLGGNIKWESNTKGCIISVRISV